MAYLLRGFKVVSDFSSQTEFGYSMQTYQDFS